MSTEFAQAISALQDALEAERVALVTNDPEGLETANHGKLAALKALEAFDGEDGLDGKLRGELRMAHDLNLANGQLLVARTHQVQAALTLLRGGDGAGTLYGPDGRTSAGENRRSLVST